ncbi:MAG: peptidoglycan-associated lipoprotein Pal [Candidatus Accumulibacter sp.]|jgi:peptidoglycan-associated lipoprotein|nr:peptidoglycan-associated lipoprotein Pal [Accumulibacter sp.]
MKRLIVPIFLAFLIAGCGTTPDAEEQAAAPVEQRGEGDGGVATVTAGDMQGRNLPPELTDPKSILSKRSIYFDYDRFDIKPEYRDLVAAHAKFLVGNRQFRMLIQGNTDERGSREYNLALGQKRADAIKKQLVLLGAREEQVESVSLGEEKPKNLGQDETAWAENRRGDLLYSGEF